MHMSNRLERSKNLAVNRWSVSMTKLVAYIFSQWISSNHRVCLTFIRKFTSYFGKILNNNLIILSLKLQIASLRLLSNDAKPILCVCITGPYISLEGQYDSIFFPLPQKEKQKTRRSPWQNNVHSSLTILCC